jgi:glutathione S-transferase
MRQLVGLSMSPWTEKARWALDHHGLAYRFAHFVPLVGEPLLRLRVRPKRGKLTVPVLLEDDRALTDSFEIARHADRVGSLARLFPTEHDDAIRRYDALSERALSAGRALVFHRMARSRDAQAESVPPFVPRPLRPSAAPLAAMTVRYLARKHGADEDAARAEVVLAEALDQLRAELGGRAHLLDRMSYADVTMAVVLQCVEPVGDRFIRLGPATRTCWRTPALVERFRDLVEWRDALYAQHRRRADA